MTRGCAGQILGATVGYRPWTPAEEAVVRQLYLVGGYKAVVAALPHRTPTSVMKRAHRLNLVARRRWMEEDDIQLRSLWGSGLRLPAIARRLARSTATTYWRAQRLGLPLGVPEDYEYLSAAAVRTGYCTKQLRMILEWASVLIHRCLGRPCVSRGKQRKVNRFHCVDPFEADDAVARWLRAEWVNSAARARGMNGETLTNWLRKSGHVKPGASRRRWRVESTIIDAVVADGHAGKFSRWPRAANRSQMELVK